MVTGGHLQLAQAGSDGSPDVAHLEIARLTLPDGVDRRLQALLDEQDQGEPLTQEEREEAEGLADLADLLSLLKLRTEREPGPQAGR